MGRMLDLLYRVLYSIDMNGILCRLEYSKLTDGERRSEGEWGETCEKQQKFHRQETHGSSLNSAWKEKFETAMNECSSAGMY
jgi:hypothetical protein